MGANQEIDEIAKKNGVICFYDHHYTHKLECDCPQSRGNDRWE
jgi:hypothetical protein